jgi:hypothetical protein
VLLNATPLLTRCTCEICWRAASKTHDGRHTDMPVRRMRQDVPHVLHQPLHTLPRPLKMKQNSGDAGLQRPQQHNRTPLVRAFWADAWETEETSVDPGMAIKEWNTVYKDQALHARVQTHSTRTSPTVSDKECGDEGKWISTHGKPVRSKLIASTRPTRPGHPTGENCRKRWRLSCPRRDALKTLPPAHHHRTHTLFVHTRRSRGHDLLAALDTMRRMQQHSGATNREHDFASRTVDLFRAVTLAHRHALNPNGLLARRGRPHHERAQTTPM